MYKGATVSVVMPAYNEEEAIRVVVEEFGNNEFVDEIIVINNNSIDHTERIAIEAGARVVKEQKIGYGYGL